MKDFFDNNDKFFIFCVLDFISILFILFLIFTGNFENILDGILILVIFLYMLIFDFYHYKKSVYKDRK